MMGRLPEEQAEFFYEFCLDTYIPDDHLLRGIDRFLDFDSLRRHLKPFYSERGRPSVDPELMIRMLIVGYCYGIRSERQLCDEVHFNLAYRWFCRLGLEGKVPEHSTFSKNRHGRFRDSEAFRFIFESTVHQCMSEGLVQGEGFATDASIVKADAQRQRGMPGDAGIDWGDPKEVTRPVREYLAGLEEVNRTGKPPRAISMTDPAASWTAAPGGPAFYAYSTNYLIDLKAGIIMDVEVSPVNKAAEVAATQTMMERVEEKFDIKPSRLVGDSNYGSAAMLGWLVDEKEVIPHVPVQDKSEGKPGQFGRSDFTWEAEADRYLCPAGHSLQRTRRKFKKKRSGITKANTIIYRASKINCDPCPLKAQCCPREPARKIHRSIHEAARDVARAIYKTEAYKQSRKDRKKVEILFAHLKRILKLDRLRLRGPTGAKDEFLLAATTQNLRRMVKLLSMPPPGHRINASA